MALTSHCRRRAERPMKASHFYSFRTRSFLDLDLICQSTRHNGCMVTTPTENASPPTVTTDSAVLERACGWFITAYLHNFTQNKCLHRQTSPLHFTFFVLHRHPGFLFCFIQTGGLWQPCFKQVYRHFSTSICSPRVSVSHFGDSPLYFKRFHHYFTCYLRTVIIDVTTAKRSIFAEGSDDG